jgi:hypothetical protein
MAKASSTVANPVSNTPSSASTRIFKATMIPKMSILPIGGKSS